LKAFYRYHDGHDVDPEQIPTETQESSAVDERDLWTAEEIGAMRSVIDSKRNEALFELLAYTGQRIRVVQTLRVKDVMPDKESTGRYYVNEEVEGRKNRQGHGPLLGAQAPIRRWLQVHPTGAPEDALITCPPNRTGGATPGERITQTSIRDVLGRIAEKAGVEKDVHPHMFRHYFTTVAKRDFGMDDAYIKRLRGDAPGSNVMETTYSHLSDEDAAGHAEAQFTGEEPEENALTPAAPCTVCGEMMQAGDAACRNCGAGRTPEAEESSGLAALIPYLDNMNDEEIGRFIREKAESEAAD
jgi:integrase